ncbi:uncharacterized protein Dyak_GE28585 [Drosophila yakuba]|uniref:Uncharacterized protein n=1 Tax=Drosophila yakuba TaxID=7245 RepID=A0A0R1E8B5_DROYA|nr:uncharacterized protein Dyak_GE28585 [Drosophila yakuba]
MACDSFGTLILSALQEKKCPVTFREILEDVAFQLKVAKMHIKLGVVVALRLGINRGLIQKSGHRFYVNKSVKKEAKEPTCPTKLVDRIVVCPQDETLLNEDGDFVEVLTYSDDEEIMVFNVVKQQKNEELSNESSHTGTTENMSLTSSSSAKSEVCNSGEGDDMEVEQGESQRSNSSIKSEEICSDVSMTDVSSGSLERSSHLQQPGTGSKCSRSSGFDTGREKH